MSVVLSGKVLEGDLKRRVRCETFDRTVSVCLKTLSFGAPTPGLLLAKYSAEKTKYVDVSQPPHQGDELKRR